MSASNGKNDGPSADSEGRNQWTVTDWEGIRRAIDGTRTSAFEARTLICNKYWQPLYSYARRFGLGPENAEDAVQGFFTKLLERDFQLNVRKGRGRFRCFLCAAMRYYLLNLKAHWNADKNPGGKIHIGMTSAEAQLGHDSSPDREFDRRVALIIMDNVMKKLREPYDAKGNGEFFDELAEFLSPWQADKHYKDLTDRFGKSEVALRQAVFRMRRDYEKLLGTELLEMGVHPEDIEEELQRLADAFSTSG